MRSFEFIKENIDPTLSDINNVAEWLNTTSNNLIIEIKQEPISKFLTQILEMFDTYKEFPNDAKRTNKIVKNIKQFGKLYPIYVEKNDQHLFVMEGRHRMVAFWLLKLDIIPVAYVSKKI
jgi:hypothetical protein